MAKFQTGKSGNPAGRPKGTKDKRAEYRELLRPHASALIETAVTLAKAGDVAALKLCLDRLCPPLRPTSEPAAINVDLSGSLADQGRAILQAVTGGKVTVEDGIALMGAVVSQVRIQELSALDERLAGIEQILREGNHP